MMRSFITGLTGQAGGSGSRSRLVIRALVSLCIIGGLFWWFSTDELLHAMAAVPAPTWMLVIGGFVIGHMASAFKWRLLLRAVGVSITAIAAMRAHGAGLFANLCLPSIIGGDVVRAGLVMRRHRRYENIALGSLADRINDTLALLLLASVAGMLIPHTVMQSSGAVLRSIALILFAGVLGVIGVIRWFPADRLPGKFASILLRFRNALELLLASPGIALLAFLLSTSIQAGFVLLNVQLAEAMGIDAPVAAWMFAWPLAKLIALAPISLGGIGVREVAIAGIMSSFGLDAARVVAQSLSWEVVLICAGLLAGLFVAVFPVQPDIEEART